MSGHSKWAGIKHKKAIVDGKRGKIFTKIAREITVAARSGGGDPEKNAALRSGILKARTANMPNDNIQRAIKKGTGDLEGVHYEEVLYEAYAPGSVAMLVKALTDNKNRSASEIRSVFTKFDSSIASPGAVSYLFKKKGLIEIPVEAIQEDDVFLLVTEEGAEDFKRYEDIFEITTPADLTFETVKSALEKKNVPLLRAALIYLSDVTITVNNKVTASKLLNLREALEDLDDVQSVYDNSDIPDTILAEL
jgi:YebC/PmpR family DNA-binding regulatory protein